MIFGVMYHYNVNIMTGEWTPLYPKVFEPCAGKGGYIVRYN